jgi:hypothetical protein
MDNSAFNAAMQDGPITYSPVLARLFDDVPTGVLLSFMADLYLKSLDGWFSVTQEEIEQVTAISPKVQRRARATLVREGVLRERLVGIPAKMKYSIEVETLARLVENPRLVKSPCVVYLIASTDGLKKIGFSGRVGSRMEQLKKKVDGKLSIIATRQFGTRSEALQSEQEWHKLFAHKRVKGEWFQLDATDVKAFIDWSKENNK